MANFVVGVLQNTPEYGQIIRPVHQGEGSTAKATAWAKKNLDADKFDGGGKIVVIQMTASFNFKTRPILIEDDVPTLGEAVHAVTEKVKVADTTVTETQDSPAHPIADPEPETSGNVVKPTVPGLDGVAPSVESTLPPPPPPPAPVKAPPAPPAAPAASKAPPPPPPPAAAGTPPPPPAAAQPATAPTLGDDEDLDGMF